MLAMLNEPHLSLKLHAHSNLNKLVDTFWPRSPLVGLRCEHSPFFLQSLLFCEFGFGFCVCFLLTLELLCLRVETICVHL
ncbi:hypothetical protein LR48_Vigan630s000900 [Vigna angularis]|uniref:Uncharacterized protein n=1 Tax=Phaseolus angularis TaxID=3914 RepID=A0A0L9TEM4_PHAAN|nr:hypothetical protein LR48_Vigan630s000900 [Vigna angularis]